LGAWFAGCALAIGVAIIMAFVYNSIHERDVAVGVARNAAGNLVESLAQQASDTFDAVDSALRIIQARVESRGTGLPARVRLNGTMSALSTMLPRIHFILVADGRGKFVVSSFAVTGRGQPDLTDRPYFRYHRDHRDSATHISGPAHNRFDKSWVIFATRRINHRDGSFAGVAVATISLGFFQRSYANVDTGRSGAITMFASDGTILMHKPFTFIGRRVADARLFLPPHDRERSGWYIGNSRVDGMPRLFAFRRLARYPVAVQVAVAQSEYLAEWQVDARSHFLALMLIVAMGAGLAAALSAQIARRKHAEETLAALALLDGLTGLANRRQFDERLEREWRRAARDRSSLALLMIDVDSFKAYNDLYGHQQGDTALISIARAIAGASKRPSDLAARYGGEEFVLILPATDSASAAAVAERVRSAVIALNLPHAGAENGIASVSIGVASIVPPRSGIVCGLVAAADDALYDAKRTGRNRTCVSRIPTSRVVAPAPERADT
jgi:diguanylate cyclase (GGDEF)-like protein